METPLPPDFKEFLALVNSEKIEYLMVGGYAVSYNGYPRPTGRQKELNDVKQLEKRGRN